MKIFNKNNTSNTGNLPILKSHMLIGSRNVPDTRVSIQISQIPVKSEQPLHSHGPEQVYYIIRGSGLMIIENEHEQVRAGDAVYIPANAMHGIKNIGDETLEYLTANSPPFSVDYENKLWP